MACQTYLALGRCSGFEACDHWNQNISGRRLPWRKYVLYKFQPEGHCQPAWKVSNYVKDHVDGYLRLVPYFNNIRHSMGEVGTITPSVFNSQNISWSSFLPGQTCEYSQWWKKKTTAAMKGIWKRDHRTGRQANVLASALWDLEIGLLARNRGGCCRTYKKRMNTK